MAEPGPRQVFNNSITRIAWGSKERWLSISNSGANPDQEPPAEFEFRDKDNVPIVGATLFKVPQAFHAPPPGFTASEEPHKITAADLQRVEGSGSVPPKPWNVFRTWLNAFNAGGSTMYINVKPLPDKFKLFARWIDPGIPGISQFGFTVGLALPGKLVAGRTVPDDNALIYLTKGINGVLLGEGDSAKQTALFNIDKTEGTVTLT